MEPTFGQLLALSLKADSFNNIKEIQSYSLKNQNLLKKLMTRLQEFLSASKTLNEILNSIPIHECHQEKTFLRDNDDFFLALILSANNEVDFETECTQLTKHLNDCFNCFEVFHHVMRDYYNKLSELSNRFEYEKGYGNTP